LVICCKLHLDTAAEVDDNGDDDDDDADDIQG